MSAHNTTPPDDCAPVRFLSPDDVAKLSGWALDSVWSYARAGKIPFRRFGRRWLISRADLETWYASLPGATEGGA